MKWPGKARRVYFLYYCRVKPVRNIRCYFGRYYLARRIKKLPGRNKRIFNFSTAGSAGLIFECRSEEEFRVVKEFKHFLEQESIATDVVGYVSDKHIPDHYLLRTGFNFFCQKDLNWYFRPETSFTEDFLQRDFDLLFDLSLRNLFPVNYLVKLSPAAYKIGRFRETDQYDLMIDIKEEPSVSFFISQLRHYLSMLHTRMETAEAN